MEVLTQSGAARARTTVAAMPIVPDDKNWTWVLERACPDCGFDARAFDPTGVRVAVEANAARWRVLLADPRAAQRPDHRPARTLVALLTEVGPTFANWDQDATAVKERYERQNPADVAGELRAAAGMLSARYATVSGDRWQRTGFRSDGAAFTIDSFTRYLVHDPVHHVHDAEQGYARLGGLWAPPAGEPA